MGGAGPGGQNTARCTGIFVCIHGLTLSSRILVLWVHSVARTEVIQRALREPLGGFCVAAGLTGERRALSHGEGRLDAALQAGWPALLAKSGFHCGLQNLSGSYLALYIES